MTQQQLETLFLAFVKIEMEVGNVSVEVAKANVKAYMLSDKFKQSLLKGINK